MSSASGFSDARSQPHGAGRAGGSRPLALHGQHRVHEVQPGRGPERQIQQHVGKLPLILVAGVEPHFGYAGDQPEVVFTAPVMLINRWVFSLHKLRMPSLSTAGAIT